MQTNVLDYLLETVSKFPEKTAVSSADSSLSFSELLYISYNLSMKIRREKSTSPVLLLLNKSPETVGAMIGALISNNLYCPVDPKSPLDRMQSIVSNLDPVAIVTTEEIWKNFSSLEIQRANVIFISSSIKKNINKNELSSTIEAIKNSISLSIDVNPAYVIYTSGSTGVPKGVTISHRSIIDYIDWALETFTINNIDKIANQAPFYFDNSTLDIYLCLATGAELVLFPEVHFSFPSKLVEELERSDITFIFWVPSVLVNVSNRDSLSGKSLPNLRTILFAGEVMPAKQLRYWFDHLPNATFANLYGPTEITVDCTFHKINENSFNYSSIPIGYSCENTQILVIDDDGNESNEGELLVRGAGLSLGYWGQKELTSKAFIQNPFNSNFVDFVYKTGDRVFINDEGLIFYKGRVDQQIKHRGYRIELGEIEVSAQKIPEISQACAVYDDFSGQIKLFVTTSNKVTEREILSKLSDLLPGYMIPSKIEVKDELPLSQNGKIDRKLLKLIATGEFDG